MSRLIVKGLPKRYDEALVRQLFGGAGEVTDAKVMRTADGRSRQFAFVGFRSADAAQRARRRVDRTYVDTAQVSVEVARPIGDAAIPRPWSKYSKGSSSHDAASAAPAAHADAAAKRDKKKSKKKTPADQANAGARAREDDPAFADFRDAVSKRARKPLWADGVAAPKVNVKKSLVESRKTGGEGKLLEKSHVVFEENDEDDDDELYEELPDAAAGEKSDQPTNRADSVGDVSADGENGEDENAQETAAADDDTLDDAAYFKSKVRTNLDDEDDPADDSVENESTIESDTEGAGNESSDDSSSSDSVAGEKPDGDSTIAPVTAVRAGEPKRFDQETVDASETGRLFVRNLAFSATVDELETLFEPFGAIADIHLVQDPRTKQSRGVAFVLYVVPENAVKAMEALDNTVFFGRLLHILPGKPRPQPRQLALASTQGKAPGSNTFKEDREAERRESARTGADATAYNAMFMSTDAVADVMADRFGVRKGELFGTGHGDAGSAAVRLAAAEARLQAEMREYFAVNGIDLDIAQSASRLARRKKVSRTAFLVKNLPARIPEVELESLFGKFGSLDRLLVSPAGLLGVVVYESANDAKKAYNSLAYTRLKDTPLYLEWLPVEAVVAEATGMARRKASSGDEESKAVGFVGKGAIEASGEGDAAEDARESLPQVSVFVKNLNFDTRDDALRKHITKTLRRQPNLARSLRAATVATRKNEKDLTGPRLSYGYGFLEFASERDAKEAVKLAHGTKLDGHTLELRVAKRGSQQGRAAVSKKRSKSSDVSGKPSAKLMIRNIAFEATTKDVRHLFSTFGQVKSIRVPRKQDGTHRGFGFVEFVSKNEAKAARDALAASHLYGRHLVIDYAHETESGFGSLEDLQARAARQVVKRRRIEGVADGSGRPVEGQEDVHDDDTQMMMDEMFV